MFSLSPFKILVIVGVIMVLMGPDKLPEVAHRLGAAWRTIKSLQERVEAEVREAIPDLPSTSEIARIARSPVNLLNQLADRVDAKEAAAAPRASAVDPAVEETPLLRTSSPLPERPRDERARPPDPSLN